MSRDPHFVRALSKSFESRGLAVEVHVVVDFDDLCDHVVKARPDYSVMDLDDTGAGVAEILIASEFGAEIPLIAIDRQPTVERERQLNQSGVISCLRWDSDFGARVADLLMARRHVQTSSGRVDETEQHYRTILESSSDGIFVLVDQLFRYVNPSLSNALGYGTPQLLGRVRLTDLCVEEQREHVREVLARVEVSGGVREVMDLKMVGADGRTARFEVSCRPSVVDGRRAIIGVARDVTATRELEAEIERARQRAAQVERLRALGELAAGVAHDFNNALTTMKGRLRIVRDKIARELPISDDLSIIESAVINASDTAQRIQQFSKPANTDSWTTISLSSLLREVVAMVEPLVPQCVTVSCDLRPTPQIQGNAGQLCEVFLNLLRNALDATKGGGEIHVSTVDRGDAVVVEICDSGTGMPKEVQDRIFEPFFTTKGERGTGLGLSVSSWILRQHDADMAIDSEPNVGTKLTIAFAPMAGQALVARDSGSGDVLRIVVVDDDASVADMVRDLLMELGHDVTTALDPGHAARMIGEQRTDVLLTDLDLPGMSGWELARRVRDIQPDIRVGLITGWGLGANESELRAAGVDFVLPKPFSADALYACIGKLT